MVATIRRKRVAGMLLLLLVVVIWVGSSSVIQYVFLEEEYGKPFAITYFFTCLFTIYLTGFLFMKSWRKDWNSKSINYKYIDVENNNGDENGGEGGGENNGRIHPKKLIWISFRFCIIWFVANYCFNYSLMMTSIASNTIISTCSSFFTLLIGIMYGVEMFSVNKFMCIILCVSGVSMIMLSDHDNNGNASLFGDFMAFISAITYGGYTVYLKKNIPNEKSVSMPMFFGFVGLGNLFGMWPVGVVLHYLGIESFDIPSTKVLLTLLANGLVGTVLSDVLWGQAVILTSPVVATMAVALTVPLAMTVDLLVNKKQFHQIQIIGALIVITSFFLENYYSSKEGKKKKRGNIKLISKQSECEESDLLLKYPKGK